MDKRVDINDYSYDVHIVGNGKPTWVFLHGFLGSQTEFQYIQPTGTCVYITLKGFGAQASMVNVQDMTVSAQLTDLHELFKQLGLVDIYLVGYSMGARLALSFALMYPEMLKHLVLESGTAGLQSVQEQIARQNKDEHLAQRLEKDGMPAFVAMWEQLPLFATQQQVSPVIQEHVRQQRLQQVPQNMAASLRAFGTGSMPNYWTSLHQLAIPTTLITGATDEKFTNIGGELQSQISMSEHIVVPNVGHNVHVEAPDRYTAILNHLR